MTKFVNGATAALDSLARYLESQFGVEHRLTALSILRILLGVNIAVLLLQHFDQRHLLWGARGIVSFPDFYRSVTLHPNWSIWQYSSSGVFEEAVYWTTVTVAMFFTLGVATRLNSIMFWCLTWSLYQRNPYVINGGDNLLYLIAFLMMFVNCGARFSIDARLGWRLPANKYLSLIHNLGVTAICIQVCLLYLTSVFFKIQGHVWQNGTAIYYILRNNEFDLSPYGQASYESATLGTVLTYGTLVLQSAFPFLIFHKRLKWILAPATLSFHLAIAYFMGLTWFSETMIAAEAVFFSDRDFTLLRAALLLKKPNRVPEIRVVTTASAL